MGKGPLSEANRVGGSSSLSAGWLWDPGQGYRAQCQGSCALQLTRHGEAGQMRQGPAVEEVPVEVRPLTSWLSG